LDFGNQAPVGTCESSDPKRNFETFAASLKRAGFEVVPHGAPWSPDWFPIDVSRPYMRG